MIYFNRMRGRTLKTIPLLLSMFMAWTGDVYSQISLKANNQTVQQIMKNIEKQSKYKFFYNSNFNVLSEKKNLSVNDASIENTLTKLFANTGVAWEIKDNVIVLTPAGNKSAVKSDSPKGATKKIKGVVTDGTGEPVIGANVVVQGTTTGTITDFDGNFTLDVPDNSVLKVSYIGMTDMLVQTKGKDYLDVKMDNNSQALDEVVVVGYGVQKKVNLTGAVSAINMDDALGNRPVNRALEAVEGLVPGFQVNKNSGKPGVSINMNIRGVTSINGGGPLVLVDNVPMSLDMVDPNDIESISVLKDAAASAIYGARAAFGVVLVTTKQGKKDTPTRVTYNNNFAFSKLMTAPEKASPMQTLEYFKDLGVENYWSGQNLDSWFKYMDEYENQGLHQEGFVWGEDGCRYNLAKTDSYKDMMDKYGFQQSLNLAVQGGSSKLTYRASFGYVNENGILITKVSHITKLQIYRL
ncbi:MAG: SusC/RagA family TonB-linked outer membrane protein [Bacteroidales bacterium]